MYSSLAAEIWNEYADEFQRRWGIDMEVAAIIGARGKSVWRAEFMERGHDAYSSSVLLPIRNAFYAASVADERWKILSGMSLKEPILDYGCGVGFQLLWLKRKGFNRLYGWEIPGIQHDVLSTMLGRHDIGLWDEEAKVNTILCTNVLEHVENPITLLSKLLNKCDNVIANVCEDRHESSHIAPHDALLECKRMLTEKGLYCAA